MEITWALSNSYLKRRGNTQTQPGEFCRFLAFRRYLEMAEEHAALNRSTEDYLLFAKILRLTSEVLIRPNKALHDVKDIL